MKVLVVGDTILDRYIKGVVERISPEAPVPVLQFEDSEEILGGACNVAVNIRTLSKNKDCQIDYFGFGCQIIIDKLAERGINFKGIAAPKDKILQKIRYTSSNYHLLRVDRGTIYDKEYSLLVPKVIKSLELDEYDLIVLSDYNKGTLSEELFEYILEKYNKTIIFDLKKYRNWITNLDLSNTIIKCNKKEYEENNISILKYSNVKYLIETLGKDGYKVMKSFSDSGSEEQKPPAKIHGNVVDVVGAGDTFLAGMAASFIDGNGEIFQMTEYGNKAAAIKVQKFGTTTVSYKEIQ